MMRIVEHGLPVRLVPVTFVSYPVDTPDDLRRVERLMEAMR